MSDKIETPEHPHDSRAAGGRLHQLCSDSVTTDMLRAMDALWGALDAAHDMLSQTFDQEDGRFVKMGDALGLAQDLLTPYFEHGKIVLPSQNDRAHSQKGRERGPDNTQD